MEQTSAKREKRKSLLRIAIPIILSSCLQISYDITDMFPVAFQSDSFKQQRLQHSILKYSHLYQFFCTDNLYPCPVFLYDVCNEVIRFPVHSKSAVEVIHYLDMLSLFYEFSTTFM